MGNRLFSQVPTQRKKAQVVPGLDVRKDLLTAQALTGAQGSSAVPTPENVPRSRGGTKGVEADRSQWAIVEVFPSLNGPPPAPLGKVLIRKTTFLCMTGGRLSCTEEAQQHLLFTGAPG